MSTSWRAPDPQPRAPGLCQQGHPSSAARAGTGTQGCFPDPSSRTERLTFPRSSSDPSPREEGPILCSQSACHSFEAWAGYTSLCVFGGLTVPARGHNGASRGAGTALPSPGHPELCPCPAPAQPCRAVPPAPGHAPHHLLPDMRGGAEGRQNNQRHFGFPQTNRTCPLQMQELIRQ